MLRIILTCQVFLIISTWARKTTDNHLKKSPLKRSSPPYGIVCPEGEWRTTRRGPEITFDPELREAERPYLDRLPQRADPLGADPSPPFSPEYETFRERVMHATARILAENPEGQVLVVAHAGTLGTMLRGILGFHALLVRTDQAAVHCLRWEDGLWNLQYVNRQDYLASLLATDTPTAPPTP